MQRDDFELRDEMILTEESPNNSLNQSPSIFDDLFTQIQSSLEYSLIESQRPKRQEWCDSALIRATPETVQLLLTKTRLNACLKTDRTASAIPERRDSTELTREPTA
jgi:hypothetical protein